MSQAYDEFMTNLEKDEAHDPLAWWDDLGPAGQKAEARRRRRVIKKAGFGPATTGVLHSNPVYFYDRVRGNHIDLLMVYGGAYGWALRQLTNEQYPVMFNKYSGRTAEDLANLLKELDS